MPTASVVQEMVVPPGGYFGAVIEPGQQLRLEEVEDQQVADLMSFNRADAREQLSMFVSRAVARNWKLTVPHRLYSNLSREMWQIEADTVGDNYCGGGYCNRRINELRYGRPNTPSCEDNLERALAPYGLDRWSFNADTCFNVFMNVAYEPDHRWEIREPKGRAGDYMIMRSLMSQIVAISNCPQILNPCNGGRLKPLKVQILA
jgi:uncharacterized protein YcgI (DUF1989 family)